MRKIKAFTLVELMIVMLISSIAFGIAYLAFRSVTTFQSQNLAINAEISQYRTLYKLFGNDMADCETVLQKDEKTINLNSRKMGVVTYLFGASDIFRITDSGGVDSFKVLSQAGSLNTKFFDFQSHMISESASLQSFIIILLHWIFRKEYSPDIVINKHIDSLYYELH
jgi:prepilin-type N-terminal cleavage/methylation domain-containing protein